MRSVIGHYYVEPKYHKSSWAIKRVATECSTVPLIGSIVFLKPDMMEMNDTKLLPGLYKVVKILPNKKEPETIFDYSQYPSFYYIEQTLRFIVEPIVQVPVIDLNNFSYATEECVNDKGEVTQKVTYTLNGKTHEGNF